MTLVVTPWKDPADLINVWKLFHTTGPDAHASRRKACDIVQIWESRSAGKLPHQIVSTAALVDAQLHDQLCTRTLGAENGHSVRSISAVHAMALLSFITGTADIEQTREHKMSMFDVAKAINLPARLVEIRHTIVHEGVPSLAVLRQASEEALEWLKSEYWSHVISTTQGKGQANST